MDLVGYDPLVANHEEALAIPGQVYVWKRNAAPTPGNTDTVVEYGGLLVRYVLAEDADITAGEVLQWATAEGIEVTNDRSGGTAVANSVAGVALAAITDGNYGFIQVAGVGQAALLTDGTAAAGIPLMISSTDGSSTAVTITSTAPTIAETQLMMGSTFAMCFAADTSFTLAAGDYIITGIM